MQLDGAAKRKEHGSIWAMPKPALVDLVVKHLGWPRDKAADETVGQLRLLLKEFNQMVKAGKALLPKRLTRSTQAELRSECAERGIVITAYDTHEELIRELKKWAAQIAADGKLPGAGAPSSSTSGPADAGVAIRLDAPRFKPVGRPRRRRAVEEDLDVVDLEDSMSASD